MKFFLSSKIHGLTVTDKDVAYEGSVSVDAALLKRAGIQPYELVQAVNLSNGKRWETYVIEAPEGSKAFVLNGGSAYCGEVGDTCLIMTYELAAKATPTVVRLGEANEIREVATEDPQPVKRINFGFRV